MPENALVSRCFLAAVAASDLYVRYCFRNLPECFAEYLARATDVHTHAAFAAFTVALAIVQLNAGYIDEPGFECCLLYTSDAADD